MVTGKLFSDTSSCMQYCIFLVKFVNLILFLLFATGCTCLVNKDFERLWYTKRLAPVKTVHQSVLLQPPASTECKIGRQWPTSQSSPATRKCSCDCWWSIHCVYFIVYMKIHACLQALNITAIDIINGLNYE